MEDEYLLVGLNLAKVPYQKSEMRHVYHLAFKLIIKRLKI
jgi:hypothetical protein